MSYIQRTADRIVDFNDTDWNMNMGSFDWVPGVGLYGVYLAYEKTAQPKYLDYLINWTDKFLDHAYDKKTVNSTAPLLTVIELYKITKNEKYLKVCLDIAEYITNEAPLTREGGLEHTVTEAVEGFSEQIWADTLFMVCIFLSKIGKLGNPKYSDFAVKQLQIHHKLLADDKTNLYYHGWNCALKNHMSGVYWGRANAWIIYSTMEILNTLGDFEGRGAIEEYVRKHSKALAKVQRADGTFGTVLDDESSYTEVSATSGIIAGIKKAVKAGIIEESYNELCGRGIESVKGYIRENGEVDGVSTGTPVMPDKEAYKNIPLTATLYGQGLAIAALAEF